MSKGCKIILDFDRPDRAERAAETLRARYAQTYLAVPVTRREA